MHRTDKIHVNRCTKFQTFDFFYSRSKLLSIYRYLTRLINLIFARFAFLRVFATAAAAHGTVVCSDNIIHSICSDNSFSTSGSMQKPTTERDFCLGTRAKNATTS
jgi:hypothetical protein